MIASHDSYTYKSCENPIYNLLKFTWKTQDKTLDEQYNSGVRYFDLRFRFTKNKNLQPCHGLVDLGIGLFSDLSYMVSLYQEKYPDIHMRIILEKGNKSDEEEFIKQSKEIYNKVDAIIIKKDWKVIKQSSYEIEDYTWCPFKNNYTLLQNIKNWWNTTKFKTIRQWSKGIQFYDDSNKVVFLDFV